MSDRKRPVPPPLIMGRAAAVRAIADHIADRTAFIVSVPPTHVDVAARGLCTILAAAWYGDNGTGVVLQLQGPAIRVAAVMDAMEPGLTAAVAIVPKTVPATTLAAVLGRTTIPGDGSQDLIIIQDPEAPTMVAWPMLLVEALAIVDPVVAAAIAATDVRGLS